MTFFSSAVVKFIISCHLTRLRKLEPFVNLGDVGLKAIHKLLCYVFIRVFGCIKHRLRLEYLIVKTPDVVAKAGRPMLLLFICETHLTVGCAAVYFLCEALEIGVDDEWYRHFPVVILKRQILWIPVFVYRHYNLDLFVTVAVFLMFP